MARLGRKPQELIVTDSDRVQLQSLARSQTLPAALSRRAQMILAMAEGESNSAVARRFRTSRPTVTLWRTRFRREGIAGLHNALKPGRPRATSEEKIAELINTALKRKPKGKTHWSRGGLAQATRLSKTTVHRYLTLFGLQPHRTKSFKLSSDPFFIGVTHDYIRHGTTTLFAALDVANGAVLTQCKRRHRHQEFLAFLRHIEANVPAHLDVHLILDNYATHKHARVKAWLARRPRFHLHFTPTYSSWLNQVERWFGLITQQAIRRGSFDSVIDLKRKINEFVAHYNQHPKPFKWTATTESILAKLERLCKVINGTGH